MDIVCLRGNTANLVYLHKVSFGSSIKDFSHNFIGIDIRVTAGSHFFQFICNIGKFGTGDLLIIQTNCIEVADGYRIGCYLNP